MLLDYVKQQGLEFEKEAEQKNISLQKIQNGKLVIYGYGIIGKSAEKLCKRLGLKVWAVCDKNKIGEACDSGKIESVEGVVERLGEVILLICARGCFDEIKTTYCSLIPEENMIDGDEFYHYNPSYFVLDANNPYLSEIKEYMHLYQNRRTELEHVLNALADQKSVDTIENRFKYIFTRNKKYLEGIYETPQYFPKDFMAFKDKEVLLDCGAYDGDTLLEFLSQTKEGFAGAYCFEPGTTAREKLATVIEAKGLIEKVKIYPFGAFDWNGTVHFCEDGTASKITEEAAGTFSIDTIRIDDLELSDVTFLKMDIEGSELAALRGAQNTIKRCKPNLAICIYHKPEDTIEIPLYIMSLGIDYKYYVRQHDMSATETVFYAIR